MKLIAAHKDIFSGLNDATAVLEWCRGAQNNAS
jgi:hypothetical protein